MSTETSPKVQTSIGGWIAIGVTFAGVISGYTILKMNQYDLERRVGGLEAKNMKSDDESQAIHILLARIDERTKSTDEKVNGLKAQIEKAVR